MYNTNPTEARRTALRGTKGLSRTILDAFPDLVACPVPSGNEAEFCYRDVDVTGPIMCSWREASILFLLALYSKAEWALEIGCSVGWSTAHIAGATRVIVVDPFTEGGRGLSAEPNLDALARFRENMQRLPFGSNWVALVVGASPEAIPTDRQYGFAFIDGWHFDGQPLADVTAVMPLMTEDGIICMHDSDMPDVKTAGLYLLVNGWSFTRLGTACHMSIFYRTEPSWLNGLLEQIGREL